MGMDQNNYNRYKSIFDCYFNIYDLPLIKTDFFQEDYRAMNYCENRDFVALVVPFGDPNGDLANKIVVQNNLVSYTKMYSDLIGGSADSNKDFLSSAIELAKRKANLKNLEELTPIALIENSFTYGAKKQSHYGVVFMARIPTGRTLGKDVVSKSINEKVYFANPHNQILFELAKKYVESYKTNSILQQEIKYSRKPGWKDAKIKKEQFLRENSIKLDDYYQFKRKIVAEVKKAAPESIMDIACGDDDIIYDFLKINTNVKVYANDIAISYLENYHYHKKDHTKILFSNLNAIELPLKSKSIDTIFCKNLLHHLRREDRIRLINNCLKICKTMIIVEILCYKEQNDVGKLLHDKFYSAILGETKSKEYLSSVEIKELLSASNIEIQSDSIEETQNGRYRYVWIRSKT